MSKTYHISVSHPWFGFIQMGVKTVEGRKNKGLFADLKIGDVVYWTNGNDSVKTKIVNKKIYKSFYDMIEDNGIKNVLPGYTNIKEGVEKVYYKFYTPEDEKTYGVVGIEIKKID